MKLLQSLWSVLSFIWRHPLHRRRRLAAIVGFIRWQIGMRLVQKKVIVPWVEDARFLSGLGEFGLTGNIYGGFMEYEDMVFLLHVLRPHHTFVDVGANVGAYTILASKVVGSRTIAFEPLPETARRLREQVRLNSIEDLVDVRNIGVGNREEELLFTTDGDTTNKVSVSGLANKTTKIRMATLDGELEANGEYVLKIDVEGFESQVIEGATSILASRRAVAMIVELNGAGVEFGHTNDDVHKRLIAHGLIPVSYDPLSRRLTRLNSYNPHEGNTLYVKSIEQVETLARSAPLRVVHTAHSIRL